MIHLSHLDIPSACPHCGVPMNLTLPLDEDDGGAFTFCHAGLGCGQRVNLAYKNYHLKEAPKPNLREITLDFAKQCVLQDRNTTHGDPEDNFRTIAEYWTSYAHSIGFTDTVFGSKDVAAMMILMKVSRLATSPKKLDHYVDIAGYSACGADVAKAS